MPTMKIMPLALMVAAVLAGCNDETINNTTTIVPDKDRPTIELTGNTKFVDPFIGTGFNGHTFPGQWYLKV